MMEGLAAPEMLAEKLGFENAAQLLDSIEQESKESASASYEMGGGGGGFAEQSTGARGDPPLQQQHQEEETMEL